MSAACAPSPEDPAQACSRRAVPRPGWEGMFSLGAGKPLRFSLSPSMKFPEDAAPTGTGPQGTRSVCALQTLPGERIRAARFILAFLGSKAEGERPCRSLLCQRPMSLRAAAEAMPRPKQTAEPQLGVTPSRATSRPLFCKPPAARGTEAALSPDTAEDRPDQTGAAHGWLQPCPGWFLPGQHARAAQPALAPPRNLTLPVDKRHREKHSKAGKNTCHEHNLPTARRVC